MKKILILILTVISLNVNAQNGFSVIAGTNVYASLPPTYSEGQNFATIIYFPDYVELGGDKNLIIKYGPNSYAKDGWDGVVTTANGQKVSFLLISVQIPTGFPRPQNIQPVIAGIIQSFKVDTSRLYVVGNKRGAWSANNYALYIPTANNFSYQKTFKAVINIQGQPSDDNFGVGVKYPDGFKSYVLNGGKYLGLEQVYAQKDMKGITTAMNSSVPNSATYFTTDFGDKKDGNFDYFFGGNGRTPQKLPNNMTIYEWLANLKPDAVTSKPPVIQAFPGGIFGREGVYFELGIGVVSGDLPVSFSSTNLPSGLTITNEGVIKGIPATAGTFTATIKGTNQSGSTTVSYVFNFETKTKKIRMVNTYEDYNCPTCSYRIIYYDDNSFKVEKLEK